MRFKDKVVFDANPPPLPDRFPHRHGGSVTIRMRFGATHTHTCKAARGVEWSDVDDKYRRLVALSGLPVARSNESLAAIHAFEKIDAMAAFVGRLNVSAR